MSDKLKLDELGSPTNNQPQNAEIVDTSVDKKEKKPNRLVLWLKKMKPSKRKIIQLYSALLFNANLKGFATGKIFQGNSKNLCTPGLNCYSCPGAVTACPLGSLQNTMTGQDKSTAFYIIGIILLYGLLAGRFICGWLCPFGLIQELLYKIKTPKLKKSRFTRILSYLKYFILVFFTIVVPLLYSLRNVPVPGFCKYICPAGTLEGAIGLLSNKVNESSLRMLGPIFTWKFILMVSIIVASVFIFRVFCRFICPLGALYGLFNKISILGIKLDKPKCVDCGKCVTKCKMDIKHVGDMECISCGECIDVCPTKAISFKGSKIMLLDNEIDSGITATESEKPTDTTDKKKMPLAKKRKIFKIVLYSVLAVLLVGSLVYFNFIHKSPASVGCEVGNLCPGADLRVYDQNGLTDATFNPANNKGKITVINFWGIWCTSCLEELPYFDKIATEYKDKVTVVAVHSMPYEGKATKYINENYPNSNIIFTRDNHTVEGDFTVPDYYFTALGGENNLYPMTLILDENGIIVSHYSGSLKYEELENDIKSLID